VLFIRGNDLDKSVNILRNQIREYLSNPPDSRFQNKPSRFNHSVVILPNCGKKLFQKMLVVRVTENVRAVQSSYYSSCPWVDRPDSC
jgi:hypothetical protein